MIIHQVNWPPAKRLGSAAFSDYTHMIASIVRNGSDGWANRGGRATTQGSTYVFLEYGCYVKGRERNTEVKSAGRRRCRGFACDAEAALKGPCERSYATTSIPTS
jgi:hypothetical protein